MTASSHGQPCVLIVDDSQTLREGLAELLPEFHVLVAATLDRGEAVVPTITAALAQRTHVNVVVMDVRMPGIGGLAATRQVRAAFPHIQVLLHTAFAGHLEAQAEEVGAFAEVAKGTGIQELVEAIWHAYHSTLRRTA